MKKLKRLKSYKDSKGTLWLIDPWSRRKVNEIVDWINEQEEKDLICISQGGSTKTKVGTFDKEPKESKCCNHRKEFDEICACHCHKEIECTLEPYCKCEDCRNYEGGLPIDRI